MAEHVARKGGMRTAHEIQSEDLKRRDNLRYLCVGKGKVNRT
jgi:hypothetical protein